MRDLLLKALGVDPASRPEGSQWSLEFLSQPSGDIAFLVILAALLAGAATFYLYKKEGRDLSPAVLFGLGVLRLCALALVVFILFEPVLVSTHREYLPSRLPVLVDVSKSMGLNDAYPDANRARQLVEQLGVEGGPEALRTTPRIELARRALGDELLTALTKDGEREVELFTFSDELEVLDPADRDQLAAEGGTTRLGTALREIQARYKGLPLAGILAVTDGQSNSGEHPSQAAASAEAAGIPVSLLAVGTKDGPRNAKLAKLETSPAVFVRDPIEINAIIESRGLNDQPAELLLEARLNGGVWEELERRAITLDGTMRQQRIRFEHVENLPAYLELRAKLEALPSEMSADDNLATAKLRVVRQRIRVLFISGSTFPEIQFIRNAMIRDNSVILSSWLMDASDDFDHPGDRPIRRLPNTQEELDQYDCVVLFDPDPSMWAAHWPEMLSRFVGRAGGGLVYIAGERMTEKNFQNIEMPDRRFMKLLPVVMEPGLFQSEVAIRLSSREPWKLEITPEGKTDPVFGFDPDPAKNERIISYLPGMFWHFPVTRAKPGATVLARHGDPRMRNQYGRHVLVATHLYGPGRSYFIGFDSTYRWRYLDESFFDLFWARVIDRAGRNKQLGGRFPFTLETDRLAYQPGDNVTLKAKYRYLDDLDSGVEILRGEVQTGDRPPEALELIPDENAEGTFKAQFTVPQSGKHFLRVFAGGVGEVPQGEARAATLEFDVSASKLEFDRLTLDRSLLEQVADRTGGQVFDLWNSAQIPTAFKLGKVERILQQRTEIWDAPLFFGLILFFIFLEWVCRKVVRLI